MIAEAACYGAIPIVSDVGSIPHYINKKNGFVISINQLKLKFKSTFVKALNTNASDLKAMSNNICELAPKFSFKKEYIFEINKLIKE